MMISLIQMNDWNASFSDQFKKAKQTLNLCLVLTLLCNDLCPF